MALDEQAAERDLSWYAEASLLLETIGDQLDDLLMPTCAKWSHIGATTGRPGNPTATRGLRRIDLGAKLGPARFVVAWVDGWLDSLTAEDRMLVAILYGLRDGEQQVAEYAAQAVVTLFVGSSPIPDAAQRLQTLLALAAAFRRGVAA